MSNKRITVFTPTYNRANTINRVYMSLINQTYNDFCWLIVDDGSSDNTEEIINSYKKENLIQIEYIYQDNQGKHNAINTALDHCNTELFLIADSDDSFVANALEVFVQTWDSIEDKNLYKGVIARCYDSVSKKVIGNPFPKKTFDANELDANFKMKTTGEKWGIFKTDCLKEFRFPNVKGIKFYPETIVWQKMARKYLTRYIDIPLREYFRDQENAVTNKNYNRYKENIYLWEHILNNTYDYFFYNPKYFIKAHVGIIRDGLLNHYELNKIIRMHNKWYKKLITMALSPVGYILYKKKASNE